MDPPPPPPLDTAATSDNPLSQPLSSNTDASQDSQTAADYISSQLQLEAEAREILPYQFDTCTYPLGPLRQSVFSCLTCNPPPSLPSASYTPAGVCYSCSISCHGEHQLVELFTRRNFVCDCGTKRVPAATPCSLRINAETGTKGGVHSEEPSATNCYNQNFQNRFCGCGELYDPHQEEGTMYQCYGLGNVEDGGCGEDWWHPQCLLGLKRDWYKSVRLTDGLTEVVQQNGNTLADAADGVAGNPNEAPEHAEEMEGHPDPPGFPNEEDFDHLVCFKCVNAFPWIKRYAGTNGFLSAVPHTPGKSLTDDLKSDGTDPTDSSKKRKAEGSPDGDVELESSIKRVKSEQDSTTNASTDRPCQYSQLPSTDSGEVSLFLKDDFRDYLCKCRNCFSRLIPHPQLLEEEMIYEPPMSSASSAGNGRSVRDGSASVGSRSLLERGEAALSNMDRVKAIEGVMVYNHLRDKVKDFLKPFAESGTAVGAEDVKKYFEKLRGDEEAIKMAQLGRSGASGDGGGDEPDNRKEQGGY